MGLQKDKGSTKEQSARAFGKFVPQSCRRPKFRGTRERALARAPEEGRNETPTLYAWPLQEEE